MRGGRPKQLRVIGACSRQPPRRKGLVASPLPWRVSGRSGFAAGETHGGSAGAVVVLDVDEADYALLDPLPGALQGRADLLGLLDIFGLAAQGLGHLVIACSRDCGRACTTWWPPIFQSDLPGPPAQFDDILPAGLTMIFPAMYGWIVQIYGYSPGAAKVWEKVSSVSSAADLKVPFLSPIRCGLSSSFFQVTVVPARRSASPGRRRSCRY